MLYHKYQLKPFKISSMNSISGELRGRCFKDEDGTLKDAKFYAAEFAFNKGFKYFNIKNLSIFEGHGCRRYFLSVDATNSPMDGSLCSMDLFNEDAVQQRNILFTKRINKYVLFPIALFLMSTLVSLALICL